MNRISLYITRHLAVGTVLTVLVLAFAIWVAQSLRFMELIVNSGAPGGLFLRIVALSMPEILNVVLPIAFVGATLFVYTKLNQDSELVVMRAAGASPWRLAQPAFQMAAVVALLGYVVSLWLSPAAMREFRNLHHAVETEFATVLLQAGQFTDVLPGVTVFIRERRAAGEVHGILIHDARDPANAATVLAEHGALSRTEDGLRLTLVDGSRQDRTAETGQVTMLYFDSYTMDFSLGHASLEPVWQRPQERFIGQLLWPDLDNPRDRQEYSNLVATGHQMLATPLLVFAFAAVAMGTLLSGAISRRGQTGRVLIAIVAIALIQGLVLTFYQASRRTLELVPLLYLLPILATAAGLYAMLQGPAQIARLGRRLSFRRAEEGPIA